LDYQNLRLKITDFFNELLKNNKTILKQTNENSEIRQAKFDFTIFSAVLQDF